MHEVEKQGAMHHFSSERGPGAGSVCVRLPAKPMDSVFVRKPRGLKFRKGGPGAGGPPGPAEHLHARPEAPPVRRSPYMPPGPGPYSSRYFG